jgi:UDP-N-acetylglucosamine 2-epimerase
MFAPTTLARDNLLREHLEAGHIHVTGNTAVDAVLAMRARILQDRVLELRLMAALPALDPSRRIILVTGHRRENFGKPFESICEALAQLAARGDVEVVYPVHLNPAVQEPVRRILGGVAHVHLLPPLGYAAFTHLLMRAAIVLTDSGGIQEEAPSLGKPVLVMREVTERPEAVAAGTAKLVGTDAARILAETNKMLDRARMPRPRTNPYGDGRAAARIVARLCQADQRAMAAAASMAPARASAGVMLSAG